MRRTVTVLAAAGMILGLCGAAHAAAYEWDGGASGWPTFSTSWMTANNWDANYAGTGYDDGDTFSIDSGDTNGVANSGTFADQLTVNTGGTLNIRTATANDLHLNGGLLNHVIHNGANTWSGNVYVDADSSMYNNRDWGTDGVTLNVAAALYADDVDDPHLTTLSTDGGGNTPMVIQSDNAATFYGIFDVQGGLLRVSHEYALGEYGILQIEEDGQVDVTPLGASTGIRFAELRLVEQTNGWGTQTFDPGTYALDGTHLSNEGNMVDFTQFFTSLNGQTGEGTPLAPIPLDRDRGVRTVKQQF